MRIILKIQCISWIVYVFMYLWMNSVFDLQPVKISIAECVCILQPFQVISPTYSTLVFTTIFLQVHKQWYLHFTMDFHISQHYKYPDQAACSHHIHWSSCYSIFGVVLRRMLAIGSFSTSCYSIGILFLLLHLHCIAACISAHH
jgi:hypothetical protein